MTVILAIEHPETGEIAIGADGRLIGGTSIVANDRCKLYDLAPGVVFGLACNCRAVSLLMRAMRKGEVPAAHPEDFVYWLMDAVKTDGWAPGGKDSAGEAPWFSVQGVLVYADGEHRGAWDVSGAGSAVVVEPGRPVARGSGCDAAAGALLRGIYGRTEWAPAEEIRLAIDVASRLDVSVGGRIDVRSFPR